MFVDSSSEDDVKLQNTVEGHVLTRSGQDLTQAWAGQTHFNIGGSARLGRAHIRVLK